MTALVLFMKFTPNPSPTPTPLRPSLVKLEARNKEVINCRNKSVTDKVIIIEPSSEATSFHVMSKMFPSHFSHLRIQIVSRRSLSIKTRRVTLVYSIQLLNN